MDLLNAKLKLLSDALVALKAKKKFEKMQRDNNNYLSFFTRESLFLECVTISATIDNVMAKVDTTRFVFNIFFIHLAISLPIYPSFISLSFMNSACYHCGCYLLRIFIRIILKEQNGSKKWWRKSELI